MGDGAAVRCAVLTTLITTFGVRKNAYSSVAQVEVTLDDLFCDVD